MSEDAVRRLGELLTGTEADQLAELYREGLTLTQALQAVSASRRHDVRAQLDGPHGVVGVRGERLREPHLQHALVVEAGQRVEGVQPDRALTRGG